jgi:gamma-glutamyltranspeptidase / glutathione hydrolase
MSAMAKLPMARLLEHAIDYAENGFPANAGFVRRIAGHLAIAPDTQVFKNMGIDVNVQIGDLVVQKDLAQSLREIASGGRAAFYEGRIAQQLVKGSDGWFSAEDLKSHTTRVLEPLSVQYRDLTIYGQPPPTQGMILMEELLINERFDIAALSPKLNVFILVWSLKRLVLLIEMQYWVTQNLLRSMFRKSFLRKISMLAHPKFPWILL